MLTICRKTYASNRLSVAISDCLTPGNAATPATLPLLVTLCSPPLQAAVFSVTNTNDSGPGRLRQAVSDANITPGLDTIQFSGVSGTIELTSGLIRSTDSVEIVSPGADVLTIDGQGDVALEMYQWKPARHRDDGHL